MRSCSSHKSCRVLDGSYEGRQRIPSLTSLEAKDFFPKSVLALGTRMPPAAADCVLGRWMLVYCTNREARHCGAQPVTHLKTTCDSASAHLDASISHTSSQRMAVADACLRLPRMMRAA